MKVVNKSGAPSVLDLWLSVTTGTNTGETMTDRKTEISAAAQDAAERLADAIVGLGSPAVAAPAPHGTRIDRVWVGEGPDRIVVVIQCEMGGYQKDWTGRMRASFTDCHYKGQSRVIPGGDLSGLAAEIIRSYRREVEERIEQSRLSAIRDAVGEAAKRVAAKAGTVVRVGSIEIGGVEPNRLNVKLCDLTEAQADAILAAALAAGVKLPITTEGESQ